MIPWILITLAILAGGIWGWSRAIRLKGIVRTKDAKIAKLGRNLEGLRAADVNDATAAAEIADVKKEIIDAQTDRDAVRVLRRFVTRAYHGL